MKKFGVLFVLLLVFATYNFAQRTITGKVIDAKGEGLIGANVVANGSTSGTITDFDGNFILELTNNVNSINVSYTGFQSQTVDVSNVSDVSVTLVEGQLIDEVVVTALGIKREKKALGYASTTVSSKELADKPESDIARAIAGKSPGVNIAQSSGMAGSGTKINIRGVSTISGSSQPLWVIDGVPVNTSSNETNSSDQGFRDGNITPTRNLDIDPNNIENMSILRGLAATALYGSQGRNGVILITTKTGSVGAGKKEISGSFSQSYGQVKAHIPEYQDKWANGFDGDYGEFFSNWGVLFSNDFEASKHPYSEVKDLFKEQYPEFSNKYKPVAQPNNVKDFFQTGRSINTSFNVGIKGEKGGFSVAVGKLNETGFLKNNEVDRTNISVGGNLLIGKKLTVVSNISFSKSDFKSPTVGAGTGSNSAGGPSVFANLFYTPRNIDLMGWPYQHPVTGASVYYRGITNPRWLLENSQQSSVTNRIMLMASVKYDLTDWLALNYRLGYDTYDETQKYWVNKGGVGFGLALFQNGLLRTTLGNNSIQDHTISLAGRRELSSDIDLSFNIGANRRDDRYKQTGLEGTNQVVYGLVNHRNFESTNSKTFRDVELDRISRLILQGIFGDITFGYKNYAYLSVAARNDWASSHEKENRSLFYPSFNLSFIPTDAFASLNNNNILNYLKLRLGYGTSANFASPYRTRGYLFLNAQETVDGLGNVVSLANSSLLANANLKPELQSETEFGIEARFLNNRIGLEVSRYSRLAKDQIIARPLDPSTGYTDTYINAGSVSNKGWEIGMSITAIKSRDLEWNLRGNFTKNKSLVEKLPEGSEEIRIAGFGDGVSAYAIQGQPFGVIKGTYVKKNDKGELLVTSNGDWDISSDLGVIGDPNPDYMVSGFTDITFKGLTLSAQLDFVKGGQIFSYSAGTLIGRGVAQELESFNPELPVILPGVKADGTVNDIPMPASGVFFGNNIIGGGADDRGIYDGTRMRLREIGLSYTLPSSLIKGSPLQSVSIALNANNIWYRTFNTPKSSKVDPDKSAFGTSNALGIDFLGGPSAARYGAVLKVTF